MTKEEFELWGNVVKSLHPVDVIDCGPTKIQDYVLLNIHGRLSTILKINADGDIEDGYSIFKYDKYNGQFTMNMVNVTVDDRG